MRAATDNSLDLLVIQDATRPCSTLRDVISGMTSFAARTQWCDGCEDALSHLRRENFDAVLFDPGLGADVGRLLGSLPPRNEFTPGIVISSSGEGERFVCAGVVDYLDKGTFTSELLERALTHALDRKRIRKALCESDQRFTQPH